MELAWCRKCHADVSLAHAIAELPCPSCGAKTYFIIVESADQETLLGESERMERLGRWEDAADALEECRKRGLISAADFNLSSANLEWRRQCATAAVSLLSSGGVPLPKFRAALEADFDSLLCLGTPRCRRYGRMVASGVERFPSYDARYPGFGKQGGCLA